MKNIYYLFTSIIEVILLTIMTIIAVLAICAIMIVFMIAASIGVDGGILSIIMDLVEKETED